MPSTIGHNIIGGVFSAAGSVVHSSHDATTGEPLPYAFIQASAEEVDAAAAGVSCGSWAPRKIQEAERAAVLTKVHDPKERQRLHKLFNIEREHAKEIIVRLSAQLSEGEGVHRGS